MELTISVNSLMITLQSLPPLVPRNLQRKPILRPQLLQLRHDAIRDHGPHRGAQAIHQGLEEGQLRADGVREEIRVEEDWVRRCESGVVGEKEVGWLGCAGVVINFGYGREYGRHEGTLHFSHDIIPGF